METDKIEIVNGLEPATSESTQNSVSNIADSESSPKPPKPPDEFSEDRPIKYKWGEYNSYEFELVIHHAYEKMVFWRKNLFLLPTGKAGKEFIDDTASKYMGTRFTLTEYCHKSCNADA